MPTAPPRQEPQWALQHEVSRQYQSALQENCQSNPPSQWMGPRQKIEAWKKLGADKALLHAIRRGVHAPMFSVPKSRRQRPLSTQEEAELAPTITDYLEQKAIRPLQQEETERTRFWTDIFPRPKKDSTKVRMITDMRPLNDCVQTPRHRTDTWKDILRALRHPEAQWGITLDIRNWFHHLGVHPSTGRWMRFRFRGRGYQVQGMPFGWSLSPFWANKLSKPVRGWMGDQGWLFTWYVDDVMILGPTKIDVETKASSLVSLLTDLGVSVNVKKSMGQAERSFTYMGHRVNLAGNRLEPLPEKQRTVSQQAARQAKGNTTTPRHLAALAGSLLDASRSNAALMGLPKILMKAAQVGVNVNRRQLGFWHKQICWGRSLDKDRVPHLRSLLKMVLQCLQNPVPVHFRAANPRTYTLFCDASDNAWGASLTFRNKETHAVAQHWELWQKEWHITRKEAYATGEAVRHLLPLIPLGSRLQILTDAVSTAYAWTRGGSRIWGINRAIAPAFVALQKKCIFVEAAHIAGHKNRRADYLSRNPDCKDYKLSPHVFHQVCRHFKVKPEIDLFASRTNRQCPRYCSWRVDRKSEGNAFHVSWGTRMCWMNPPWDIIPKVLQRALQEPTKALVCFPLWRSAPWWGLFTTLVTTPILEMRGKAIFQNPQGEPLPPPRWATAFAIINTADASAAHHGTYVSLSPE